MWRSTTTSWGWAAKLLHWAMALMVLVAIPAGFAMSLTYAASLKGGEPARVHRLLSQIHHTDGFLILALATVRVILRLAQPSPTLGRSDPWRGLGFATHLALYALLFAIPLTGWAAVSSLADSVRFGHTHIWFFGAEGLAPRIARPVRFDSPGGYAEFAAWHRRLLLIGAGTLTLHTAAALHHHFRLRTSVSRGMLPLRRQGKDANIVLDGRNLT